MRKRHALYSAAHAYVLNKLSHYGENQRHQLRHMRALIIITNNEMKNITDVFTNINTAVVHRWRDLYCGNERQKVQLAAV